MYRLSLLPMGHREEEEKLVRQKIGEVRELDGKCERKKCIEMYGVYDMRDYMLFCS